MENDYDYKEEIVSSRKGFLGASDAMLISKVANLGYVPSSCNERLAILKGLYEKTEDLRQKLWQWAILSKIRYSICFMTKMNVGKVILDMKA